MVKREPQYNLAVENEVLRRHRKVLSYLASLVSQRAIGKEHFFQELVQRIAQALEIDHAKLLIYRPEHGDLLIIAGCGWKPGVVGSVVVSADMSSPPGRAYRTGLPVKVDDFATGDLRFAQVLIDHGIKSLLNVPVFADGSPWGVLEADSSSLRNFNEDTEEFMLAAAALTGLVITRTDAMSGAQEALAKVTGELHGRKLLLTEMQHRVRNNFQTILALIASRKSRFPSSEGKTLVQEISNAVVAMTLAHEQLFLEREAATLELGAYLKALVENLEKVNEDVATTVVANEFHVGVDVAVPLGLIVNEAVTNAIKHGFRGKKGQIDVILCNEGPGQVALTVVDNGTGKSEKSPRNGEGLGLMAALARQISGVVEHSASKLGGTLIRVVFPLIAPN